MKFARVAKQRTGYAYRRISIDSLWQKGYFEHVLRDDEAMSDAAKYILANPVRGGLCTERVITRLKDRSCGRKSS